MAKGAAQQAVKVLCREKMATSAAVAVVDPERCVGCLACVRCCPFDAPSVNANHVSEIPAADCRGCGICICECPARAITLLHSSDDQLNAKIDALLSHAKEECPTGRSADGEARPKNLPGTK